MALSSRRSWRPGERLLVRGDVWRVVGRSSHLDCESLRLRSLRDEGPARTILLPFDRPRPLPEPAGIRVVRPREWLRRIHTMKASARPIGGFCAIACTGISIFPYQLEPALLMRRDGVPRVIIADAVGLGKTIQAGLLLRELAAENDGLRALVVAPAGLRAQWKSELATHFALDAIEAGTPWLARAGSELPADVNPWGLPGVYLASLDHIKRPEVLRPLEDVTWDAVIVDEAHEANVGTARRAAAHAVACRARRVVLLTATPHAGDPHQFAELCAMGAHDAASPAVVMFRRSRADVAPHACRRTRLFTIRIAPDERRMHRLLEAYTTRLCDEARIRSDPQPRLVAVVLRKRALSSAASLAASCRRRVSLLDQSGVPADERQLLLPLGDEDPLADVEPDAVLGAPGLTNVTDERRLLEEIAAAADRASQDESKIRFLRRMLRRIQEPAIVFTEYRDTLERLRRQLLPLRADLQMLHGGMDLRERVRATTAFNESASLLIATDAASEGLNLQSRCRLVIHFELPWSPVRLEQRTGRVDRIGQSRRVHEALLVANDTAEHLVLAPLLTRAARSRASLPHAGNLADVLADAQIAAAVIEGVPPIFHPPGTGPRPFTDPPPTLCGEAIAEAARLRELRRRPPSHPHQDSAVNGAGVVIASSLRRSRSLAPGLFAIYEVALIGPEARIPHRELAVVHLELAGPRLCRTRDALRNVLNRFRGADDPRVREQLLQNFHPDLTAIAARHERAAASTAARERAILRSLPAATQLVQAGLFDQRAIRTTAGRLQICAAWLADAESRIGALAVASRLERSLHLRAVIVIPAGNRP